MNVRSFRAKSLPEALQLVQQELGPDAAVLQTREICEGLFDRITGRRIVEVTASRDVRVNSTFPSGVPNEPTGDASSGTMSIAESLLPDQKLADAVTDGSSSDSLSQLLHPARPENHFRRFRADLTGNEEDLNAMIADLCERSPSIEMPQSLFKVYTNLVDAEFDEDTARDVVSRLRGKATLGELEDGAGIEARLRDLVKSWIATRGPIQISPTRQKVVALVGPTGVGKTTTIAKLAANFRLREKRRVGLVTVDTYRIAAVEQLRTYADIIDLPMEVVASAREMRDAIGRLSDMDLILMDTAGRSPRDEVRIQELKLLLQEANPDEVHLVLSSTSSGKALVKTAERFATVGTNSLLITKLDEATGLGNLVPLLQQMSLPLSYLTNGQSVPDDIQTADVDRLTDSILSGSMV